MNFGAAGGIFFFLLPFLASLQACFALIHRLFGDKLAGGWSVERAENQDCDKSKA